MFRACFYYATLLATLVSCSSHDDKAPVQNPEGAWQLDSIAGPGGLNMKAEAPSWDADPEKSFQLEITKDKFRWLTTDMVRVQILEADYTFTNNRIVTKDSPSFTMSDFNVVSNDGNTLVIQIVESGNSSPSQPQFVLKKIPAEKLATRTASIYLSYQTVQLQHVNQTQSLHTMGNFMENDGKAILCEVDKDRKNIVARFDKYTVTADSIGLDANRDCLTLTIPLDTLNPAQKEKLVKLSDTVFFQGIKQSRASSTFNGQTLSEENYGPCEVRVYKSGPHMDLNAVCDSPNQTKTKIDFVCFIKGKI